MTSQTRNSLLTLAGVLLLAALGVAVTQSLPRRLTPPPAIPNTPPSGAVKYAAKYLKPGASDPPPPDFMTWADAKVTTTSSSTLFTFAKPPWNRPRPWTPPVFRRMSTRETFEIEGRRLRVRAIGVAMPGPFKHGAAMPGATEPGAQWTSLYRYYSPDGVPLDEKQIPPPGAPGVADARELLGDAGTTSSLPQVKLVMDAENWPGFHLMDCLVFDGATSGTVGYAKGSRMHVFPPGGARVVAAGSGNWHDGAMTFCLDLALGQPKTFTIPARLGGGHQDEHVALRLTGRLGDLFNWDDFKGMKAGPGSLSIEYHGAPPSGGAPGPRAFFAAYPGGDYPFFLDALDADGGRRAIPRKAFIARGPAFSVAANVKKTAAAYEFRYWPRSLRLAVELDRVPGLPHLTGVPGDLTRARVGYAQFDDFEDMRLFLEKALHARVSPRLVMVHADPRSGPRPDWPMVFKDAPVGDVLAVYAEDSLMYFDGATSRTLDLAYPEPVWKRGSDVMRLYWRQLSR